VSVKNEIKTNLNIKQQEKKSEMEKATSWRMPLGAVLKGAFPGGLDWASPGLRKASPMQVH
jgi:hypothetical protein